MSAQSPPDPAHSAPVLPDGLDDDAVLDFAHEDDSEDWLLEADADYQYPPGGSSHLPLLQADHEFARTLDRVLKFIEERLIAPDLPLPVFKLESLPNGQLRVQRTQDVLKFIRSLYAAMYALIDYFPLDTKPPLGLRKPPHLKLFQELARTPWCISLLRRLSGLGPCVIDPALK